MKSPSCKEFVLRDGQTWVCLGDSITEDPLGYVSICGEMIRERYPDRRIRIVNAGVSGNKAADMLARMERGVLSQRPDWVSISVGVNDVWHGFYDFEKDAPRETYDPSTGQPYESYIADLETIVSTLRERNIEIMLIAPSLIGDDKDSRENVMLALYATGMRGIARKYDAIFCPMQDYLWMLLDIMRKHGVSLTTDGVHMNDVGAQIMAGGVLSCFGFYLDSGQ